MRCLYPSLSMQCAEFLDLYSDFRDGAIADARLERRILDHLATCPQCMDYDARVARGVCVLRTFSDLEPTPEWRRSLTKRVGRQRLRLEEPVAPAPAGVMVGLMVATAIVLVLWTGYAESPIGTVAQTAAVETEPAPTAPLPAIVAIPSPPFVSFTHLSAPAFNTEWRTPGTQDEMLVRWSYADR